MGQAAYVTSAYDAMTELTILAALLEQARSLDEQARALDAMVVSPEYRAELLSQGFEAEKCIPLHEQRQWKSVLDSMTADERAALLQMGIAVLKNRYDRDEPSRLKLVVNN